VLEAEVKVLILKRLGGESLGALEENLTINLAIYELRTSFGKNTR